MQIQCAARLDSPQTAAAAAVIEAPALSQTGFFPAGGVVGALLFSARLRSPVCNFFTLSNPLLLMIEKQENI